MKTILIAMALILAAMPATAASQPDKTVFRTVSFICREGPAGTSVKIEENILGQRKRYEVGYFGDKPTLFVISKSKDGRRYSRVALIDLRDGANREEIEATRYLASVMTAESARFCKGSRREVLAARYELGANHAFNRSHPRYRGK